MSNETAQKIQDLYFANGATVDINTWNQTKALITTEVEAVLEDILVSHKDNKFYDEKADEWVDVDEYVTRILSRYRKGEL